MDSRRPERRKPTGERPVREDLVIQACLEAYGAIRHEGRLADRALDFTLRHKRNLYSNERRAVAERVYALLRRQITVEYLLVKALPGFDAVPSSRKDLLRLAASQVLMGAAPSTVTHTSALGAEDADALYLLPQCAAELQALPLRERFPVAASLPGFLATRFLAEFGAEAESAAEAMNERAPLCARVNTLKADREKLMATLAEEQAPCRKSALSPLGVIIETHQNAYSLPSFRSGYFELQDEGSQLLGLLVDAPPTRVVDACAGAGGKTLQLAAQMKNRGELFALDIDERRLDDLKLRARRAGVHNVRTRLLPGGGATGDVLDDLEAGADRVLVDAPCSGTGTLRRKPDGRCRLTEADLGIYVARQKELLDRFSRLVKPGGRLVYGTCSVLREENEEVVQAFLASHLAFSIRSVDKVLGTELGEQVSRDGFLRLAPHRHGTDGFFGAVLDRAR